VTQSYVNFPSGKLTLEGAWHLPEGAGHFPAVVVCHPHTLYGGEMSNNVVMALCQALAEQGLAVFRFNFRGAGGSQGSFADGIGEQEDVKAALSYVAQNNKIDSSRLGLAGYSFGAGVALAVAPGDEQVKALALISPPLDSPGWENLSKYSRPKLILGGSEDDFCPVVQLARLVLKLAEPKEYEIIRGPDHFWCGYEPQLATRVVQFFKRYLSLS
jgi:alpha/beta superfamily hydrolase